MGQTSGLGGNKEKESTLLGLPQGAQILKEVDSPIGLDIIPLASVEDPKCFDNILYASDEGPYPVGPRPDPIGLEIEANSSLLSICSMTSKSTPAEYISKGESSSAPVQIQSSMHETQHDDYVTNQEEELCLENQLV